MESMEDAKTDRIQVFDPPTLELSSFDLGAEAVLAALVEDLAARGLLDSMAADIAASVRERVYGAIPANDEPAR